jgi:hypothetical protein
MFHFAKVIALTKEKGSLDMESGSSFANWFICRCAQVSFCLIVIALMVVLTGENVRGKCRSFCRGARVCIALIENINAVQDSSIRTMNVRSHKEN